MKKILLPTDLTVQSLWTAKQMIQEQRHFGCLTIYIVHMIEMPTSINDLLFLGRSRTYPAMSAAYKDALQILHCKANENKITIKFEYIYGNNARVLKNFMQGNEITEVILLKEHQYIFDQNISVDFIPFFKKIKTTVTHAACEMGNFSEFQMLSILLNTPAKEKEEVKEFPFEQALAV
jgi:hypothetical protein